MSRITQYPKVPKLIFRPLIPLALTLKIARLLTTGAEMHVTMSRTVAAKRRKVPIWWKKPVLAIVVLFD